MIQFEKDNYAVHGLPPCSHFEINLQAGIAALKTTYEDDKEASHPILDSATKTRTRTSIVQYVLQP